MENKPDVKKLVYDKPELLDIMKRGAEGAADCMAGSSATDCWDGSGPSNYCSAGTGDF